jgi:hypothetical protein
VRGRASYTSLGGAAGHHGTHIGLVQWAAVEGAEQIMRSTQPEALSGVGPALNDCERARVHADGAGLGTLAARDADSPGVGVDVCGLSASASVNLKPAPIHGDDQGPIADASGCSVARGGDQRRSFVGGEDLCGEFCAFVRRSEWAVMLLLSLVVHSASKEPTQRARADLLVFAVQSPMNLAVEVTKAMADVGSYLVRDAMKLLMSVI